MLTKTERLILINQYQILEKMDEVLAKLNHEHPGMSEHYQELQTILERGYALNYHEIIESVWDELPETDCREVMDILDMYRVIKYTYRDLPDKSGIEEGKIRFRGFDGNNEARYLSYAKFLTEGQRRWEESKNEVVNSHSPMLPFYRRMLLRWKQYQDNYELNKEQLVELLG